MEEEAEAGAAGGAGLADEAGAFVLAAEATWSSVPRLSRSESKASTESLLLLFFGGIATRWRSSEPSVGSTEQKWSQDADRDREPRQHHLPAAAARVGSGNRWTDDETEQ